MSWEELAKAPQRQIRTQNRAERTEKNFPTLISYLPLVNAVFSLRAVVRIVARKKSEKWDCKVLFAAKNLSGFPKIQYGGQLSTSTDKSDMRRS